MKMEQHNIVFEQKLDNHEAYEMVNTHIADLFVQEYMQDLSSAPMGEIDRYVNEHLTLEALADHSNKILNTFLDKQQGSPTPINMGKLKGILEDISTTDMVMLKNNVKNKLNIIRNEPITN